MITTQELVLAILVQQYLLLDGHQTLVKEREVVLARPGWPAEDKLAIESQLESPTTIERNPRIYSSIGAGDEDSGGIINISRCKCVSPCPRTLTCRTMDYTF